jgi:hypothetical protein
MTVRSTVRATVAGVLLFLAAWSVTAGVDLTEYEQILRAVPVSNPEDVLSKFSLGMTHDDFPFEPMMHLLMRLQALPVPAPEKDAVVSVFVQALSEDLPIQGLVNKGLEGLARGIPLPQIHRDLSARKALLVETRVVLASKGIVAIEDNGGGLIPTTVPSQRFRQLLIHVSEPIADFLAGGGDPQEDRHLLYREVETRLTLLRGVTLVPDDVVMVLARIDPSDVTQIALAAQR